MAPAIEKENGRTMNIRAKLDALLQTYRIQEEFAATLSTACTHGCAACCTQNVTMTTLEGYHIHEHLASIRHLEYLNRIDRRQAPTPFRPAATTNGLAALCAEGKAPPDEAPQAPGENCPFLQDDVCIIYPARPLECRCFTSFQDCRENGVADVDPFIVTVHTLFLQFVEHVDDGGLFGNLRDILSYMASGENRHRYAASLRAHPEGFLIPNRPIPVLLIPPEHQSRTGEILSKLQHIRVSARQPEDAVIRPGVR